MISLKTIHTTINNGHVYWYIIRDVPLDNMSIIADYNELDAATLKRAISYLEGCFTEAEAKDFIALYSDTKDPAIASWQRKFGTDTFTTVVELPLQAIPDFVPWQHQTVKLAAGTDRHALQYVTGFEKFTHPKLAFRVGCCWNQE